MWEAQEMFHWLKLLSTHLLSALSNILVWGGGTRFLSRLLFGGDRYLSSSFSIENQQ